MVWNYRIVKYRKTEGWGLHEVYYNQKDEPCAMTELPCGFSSDESPEDLLKALKMALSDADKTEILLEPEKWAEFDY